MPIISRPAWIAAFLVLFGLIAMLSHFSGTTLDYSRYNPEWNGTSRFFEMIGEQDAVTITRFEDLPSHGDALLLMPAPEDEYREDEIAHLVEFLEGGNILVLVSDREDENQITSALGSDIRIQHANLTSIDRYFDHPSSVIAFPAGDDPISAGIPHIVLNRPSYLLGGVPVFESSLLSWVDADGDSRLGSEETLQRYTVIARDSVGEGTLYVIADPSIFINGMLVAGPGDGNARLAENIITARPFLIVDQGHSRTAYAPEMIRVVNLFKESTITKMALITVIFLAASLLVIPWRRKS